MSIQEQSELDRTPYSEDSPSQITSYLKTVFQLALITALGGASTLFVAAQHLHLGSGLMEQVLVTLGFFAVALLIGVVIMLPYNSFLAKRASLSIDASRIKISSPMGSRTISLDKISKLNIHESPDGSMRGIGIKYGYRRLYISSPFDFIAIRDELDSRLPASVDRKVFKARGKILDPSGWIFIPALWIGFMILNASSARFFRDYVSPANILWFFVFVGSVLWARPRPVATTAADDSMNS